MRDLITNIQSASWWISVVFLGIAVGVIATYIQKFIDYLISILSQNHKIKIEHKKRKKEMIVNELIENHSKLIELKIDISNHLLSILFIIFFTAFLSDFINVINSILNLLSVIYIKKEIIVPIFFLFSALLLLNRSKKIINLLQLIKLYSKHYKKKE